MLEQNGSEVELGEGQMGNVSQKMFCLGCRYPLIGLDEHRCPECGMTFNPSETTSYNAAALLSAAAFFTGINTTSSYATVSNIRKSRMARTRFMGALYAGESMTEGGGRLLVAIVVASEAVRPHK